MNFADLRGEYARLWTSMVIRPNRVAVFQSAARAILKDIDRYKAIEAQTGVPATVVAALHLRESGRDWNTYLGNGEPLGRVTRLVPKGRGPFASFEDGAVDAIRYDGLDKVSDWSIERALFEQEAYNGFGPRLYHKINTGYLWAGTNHYERGKYTEDEGGSHWDASLVDKQLGVAPLLYTLWAMDPSLALKLAGNPAPAPAAPPKPVTAPPVAAPAGGAAGGAVVVGGSLHAAGLPWWAIVGGVVLAAVAGFLIVKFLKKG